MTVESFNPEVVALLETYLDLAKRHAFQHVAISMCKYADPGKVGDVGVCDFAGNVCLEPSERENLGRLVGKIDASIANWTMPPRDETLDAGHVCYNVAVDPIGFDFITWLVDQEMTRVREGAPPPLKVAFWMGENGETTPRRAHWLNAIFRPALAFIGAVEDPGAMLGRHAEHFVPRHIVDAAKRGEPVPVFRAPHTIKPVQAPVTITLREAEHWGERNSNVEEWIRFARWLQARGEQVLFIRDTAKAKDPMPPGFTTYPAASLNLYVRMATYECAKVNFFVSNGPGILALHGSRPWIQFSPVYDEGDGYRPNTPSFWREHMGIEPGTQYPWCAPNQRIVWAHDTFDNMVSAWSEYVEPRADELRRAVGGRP